MQELTILLAECGQLSTIIPYSPRDYCKSSKNFVALDSHKSGYFHFLSIIYYKRILMKCPFLFVCFSHQSGHNLEILYNCNHLFLFSHSSCHTPGGLSPHFHSFLPLKPYPCTIIKEQAELRKKDSRWLAALVKKCEDPQSSLLCFLRFLGTDISPVVQWC